MEKLPPEYWETCRWYLDDVYDLQDSETYSGRYLSVAETLKQFEPSPNLVLDIGCGYSYGLNVLEKHGYDAWGIDIYGRALEQRKSNNVIKASSESLPFRDKVFDAVVSCGVLEHIHESGLERVLLDIDRVGKINLHRIHMRIPGHYWEGSWHVTVKTPDFWYSLLRKLGIVGWILEHEW